MVTADIIAPALGKADFRYRMRLQKRSRYSPCNEAKRSGYDAVSLFVADVMPRPYSKQSRRCPGPVKT
jgi:hypothetical protein